MSNTFIAIDFGRETGGTVPDDVGKELFFISYVDHMGGEWGLASCSDYGDAIVLAEKSRSDFDTLIPVVDRVLGRGDK